MRTTWHDKIIVFGRLVGAQHSALASLLTVKRCLAHDVKVCQGLENSTLGSPGKNFPPALSGIGRVRCGGLAPLNSVRYAANKKSQLVNDDLSRLDTFKHGWFHSSS